ncbi:hypothetical protein BDD43_0063 [Mucilaginibacter gracilis]|uniref:Uncharacterized protein n=1 Tax=Mucilaginibacter gracilis TaxID=423350 RepID=A0A495IT94_9SPHI|nr:hypothetical protein [Mucilaginibacter gracilis]RKR79977.1 hypothetical protein BDD43_0063 [Mucilaginibacter gracilis]
MGQSLRITIGGQDHAFKLVKPAALVKATEEIPVEVNGQVVTLVRQGRSWRVLENDSGISDAVAEAIGKAIILRYRI